MEVNSFSSASCGHTQDSLRFEQYSLDAPLKFPDGPVAKKPHRDIAPSTDVLEQANFDTTLAAFGLLLSNYIENVNPWHSFSLHTLGRLDKVLHAIFQTSSQRFQAESRIHWDRFAFGGMLQQPIGFPLVPAPSGPIISCPPLLDLAERRFDPACSRWTVNVGMELVLCRLYRAVEWATLHGATRWFCEYMTACLAVSNISCATVQHIKPDNYKTYDHPYFAKMLHRAMYMDNWRIFGTLVALFALLYNRPVTMEFASTLRCFPQHCLHLLRLTNVHFFTRNVMARIEELRCHCTAQRFFVWDCLAFPLVHPRSQSFIHPLQYPGFWSATREELVGLVALLDSGVQLRQLKFIHHSAWNILKNDLGCLEALARRVVAQLHDADTTLSRVLEQHFDAEAAQLAKTLADRLDQLGGQTKRCVLVRDAANLAQQMLDAERTAFYPGILRLPELIQAFVNIIPDMFVRNNPKHMQRLDDLVHLLDLPMHPVYYLYRH